MIEPILIYGSEVWGYEIWNLLNKSTWNIVKEYFKLEIPILMLRLWENLEDFLLRLKLSSEWYPFGVGLFKVNQN
jgi:hypothetical protein